MHLENVNSIAFVVGVISGAFIIRYVVNKILGFYYKKIAVKTKGHFDDEFIPLLQRAIDILTPVIGLSVILCHFGFPPNILMSLGGAGTLALALLVKDSVKNIMAGVTIMLDKPFRVGDAIRLPSGEVGQVENIGLRRTTLKIQDEKNNRPARLILTNSNVSSCKIVNYSVI